MKNTGTIIAGALGVVLIGVGGYFLLKSSKPNGDTSTQIPPTNSGDTNGYIPPTTTTSVTPKVVKPTGNMSTINKPPSTLSNTPSSATIQKVIANSSGVNIRLMATGTTTANPIIEGEVVRKTESKGEDLGVFTKYVEIFSYPFALFKDSYSGRNVLIPKSAVTLK